MAHYIRLFSTTKQGGFLRWSPSLGQERESLYWQLGQPLSLNSLVFASVEGKPIDPYVLTYAFTRTAKKAGLKDVRFHDLRHTFASLILLRGAKPKVISEALGHSSVAFTMDTYSHIIEGMQEDAIALLDEVLPAGENGLKNFLNRVSRVRVAPGVPLFVAKIMFCVVLFLHNSRR